MSDSVVRIPITKTDDDRRLVFGWANLPRPAGLKKSADAVGFTDLDKAAVGLSEEDSVEAYLRRVAAAYRAAFPDDGDTWSYVVATFAGSIIVESYGPTGETYYQVAYVAEGDSIAFGQRVEVEEVYVAKRLGATALSAEWRAELEKGETRGAAAAAADMAVAIGKGLMEQYAEAAKAGQIKTDLQDDAIPLEELEKAAYEFVLSSRVGGVDHERAAGRLVESFFATTEKYVAMGIPEDVAKGLNEGWFVGFKIDDDDTWQGVKSGKYSMFSVAGHSQRTKVED